MHTKKEEFWPGTMKKPIIPIVLATAAFAGGYFFRGYFPEKAQPENRERYRMERVKDGDTFVLSRPFDVSLDSVRILGINAPEKGEPFCNEAARALEDLISGREILFEIEPNSDKVSYGRAVLWPFFINDGGEKVNVAVEMVKEGYARVLILKRKKGMPLLYESQLLEAEEEAKRMGRGIWSRIEK